MGTSNILSQDIAWVVTVSTALTIAVECAWRPPPLSELELLHSICTLITFRQPQEFLTW
jgi:hypothetical protein